MKIAVVGAGIFGCTIAWIASRAGHKVELFDRRCDILSGTSAHNQFRIHRGFHYPRSRETIALCCESIASFLAAYRGSLLGGVKHFYGIVETESKTDAQACMRVWRSFGLKFRKCAPPSVCKKSAAGHWFLVDEETFSIRELRTIILGYLSKYDVKISTSMIFDKSRADDFDHVVIATYAENNILCAELGLPQKPFQFEICEKPIVSMPAGFKGNSIVFLDGPFMCVDPFADTGLFLLGNVVNAVHSCNIGESAHIPSHLKALINKGPCDPPSFSRFPQFISDSDRFFIKADRIIHRKSLFTVRAVPPYRDHDDFRPSEISFLTPKISLVFSGKIVSCVKIANDFVNNIGFVY